MTQTKLMHKPQNVPLQLATVQEHVAAGRKVTIKMVSGDEVVGVITDHDMYCLQVVSADKKEESLIYKHAIGSVTSSL